MSKTGTAITRGVVALLIEDCGVLINPRVDMPRIRRATDLKAVPPLLDATVDLKGFIVRGETP